MKTYEEVAKKVGLNPGVAKRYIRYMRTRWPNQEETQCVVGYAEEWAVHFFHGGELEAADSEGRFVLRRIYFIPPE